MKKILITGAGLIGCLTARLLAARGNGVVLLDKHPHRGAVASVLDGLKAELVEGDVTDFGTLHALVQQSGVEAVVHTAALLSTAIRRSPLDGVRVNVMGCVHVLELARVLPLRRVVLASSATVAYPSFPAYDAGRDGDGIPEDFAQRFLTNRPTSIYAATKCFDEQLALLYRDLHGVSVVALRYGAVIGAWSGPESSVPGRLLSKLIGAAQRGEVAVIDDPLLAWRGGEEFVDARDCAAANVAALDAVAPTQGVYNVGSGETSSFDDMVQAVRAIHPSMDVQVTVEPQNGFAGFPHLRPAPSRVELAARELGWRPLHRLQDSVRHFAPWFGRVPLTQSDR